MSPALILSRPDLLQGPAGLKLRLEREDRSWGSCSHPTCVTLCPADQVMAVPPPGVGGRKLQEETARPAGGRSILLSCELSWHGAAVRPRAASKRPGRSPSRVV